MRKNFAIVALFVFLCFSLFLNLAAFGERIRLNGTIEELNQIAVFDHEHILAIDEVREQMANYAWHADMMIDACAESDKKSFDENRFYKMQDVYAINQATGSAKLIKDNRANYVQNAKYISRVTE